MSEEQDMTLPTRRDKFDNPITTETYTLIPDADFILKSTLPVEILYRLFYLILSEPTTIHISLSTLLYLESQGPLTPLSRTCKLFRERIHEYSQTSGLCTTTAFGIVNPSNTAFYFEMTDWSKEYRIPIYTAPHMPVTIERFALWKRTMLQCVTDDKEIIRHTIINYLNKGDRRLVDLLVRSYKLGGIPEITEENLIERHPKVPRLMRRYIEGNMITPPKLSSGGWEDDLAVDRLYANFARPPLVSPYRPRTTSRRLSRGDEQIVKFYFGEYK